MIDLYRKPAPLPGVGAAGSEVSLGRLLENRVVQVGIRQQALEPTILPLELLQALGLVHP